MIVLLAAACLPAGCSSSSSAVWTATNLTKATGAPPAANDPFAYTTTDLAGQGPSARVIYRTANGHIEELSNAGGGWQAADLFGEVSGGAPPIAESDPVGYMTELPGQGQYARVVYETADYHIEELSSSNGQQWQKADLSEITDAPTASGSDPFAYTTDFGQGQVARVIYVAPWPTWARSGSNDIEELSNAGGEWMKSDLSDITDGPSADEYTPLFGYQTNLDGQGPAARVVYRAPSDHGTFTTDDVQELSVTPGQSWQAVNLSNIAGANVNATGAVSAYETELTGEPTKARVAYQGHDQHLYELTVVGGGAWQPPADLTIAARAPLPHTLDSPIGYTNAVIGPGPTARVVYVRDTDRGIEELSLASPLKFSPPPTPPTWKATDLTGTAVGAPPTAYEGLYAYTTHLNGDGGAVARVVYRSDQFDIWELSLRPKRPTP
jgi:hypothetical protein